MNTDVEVEVEVESESVAGGFDGDIDAMVAGTWRYMLILCVALPLPA